MRLIPLHMRSIIPDYTWTLPKPPLKNNMGQLALFGNFSGIDIVVPKGWRVIANGVNHGSGINNACANLLSDDQPVLFITYNMKLSGLNIRAEKEEVIEVEEKQYKRPHGLF
jgi:hypothetical protein